MTSGKVNLCNNISGYKLTVADVLPIPETVEDVDQCNKILEVMRRFWHAPFSGGNAMYEAFFYFSLHTRFLPWTT